MNQVINSSPVNNLSVAIALVKEVLGDNLKVLRSDTIKEHPIYSVIHNSKSTDLLALRWSLQPGFEKIDWQVVTTNYEYQLRDGIYPSFGIAPIIKRSVQIVYHATKTTTIRKILEDGLLPSSPERSLTNFPDTYGVIHVCGKLNSNNGENNSAVWWMNHFSKAFSSPDVHWGIVRIDLSSLKNVRVLQDMHSESGLVVDNIDRIPPELITEVRDYKASQ